LGFGECFFCPLIKVQTSGDWVRTPCKIVASKIYADAKRNYYEPEIQFTYRVNSKLQVSEQYDFTALSRNRSRCQEIVDAYKVGSSHRCFYDPDNPTDAVIVREFDLSFVGLLFRVVLIGAGWIGLLLMRRSTKRRLAG